MILQKHIMKNFRQFRGTQQIEFASENGENGKNVTVIFGENGRGKTSIFRAIVFCLYGEQRLSQDEEVSQKELYLVNSAMLQESSLEGKPVESFVEVYFSHKGERYTIKRSLLGMIDGAERIEQFDKVVLSRIKSDGNTQNYNDPEDIRKTINGVLDKSVKEYFLFDGEKIQRLTLASIDQRREIAKGIRNLLNVDALEKAIKATQRLKKNLSIELSKRATGEYGQIIHQLNELDEKRTVLKEKLQQLETEYSHADAQKKQIDKKLEEYKEIIHLLKERVDSEEKLKEQEEQALSLLSEMKTRTGRASLLLISDVVDSVFTSIDQKKQKGEIPSEIRRDLIEKILSEKRCICSRDILPGTESFKQIVLWKNKTGDTELESSALDVWRYLGSIRSHRDDISGTIETLLQKYAVCKNNIEKLRSKIDELSNQIGTSERKDAADLEKHRENIERKQISIEAEEINSKDDLVEVEAEYIRLTDHRKILEKEENIRNELSQRASLAEDTHKALQVVHDVFTDEIKCKLAEDANKFFAQLLDKEGRETLKQIQVNEDYSLQIFDRWGKPFLANISAGQRQIMSISFIAALAKVAAAEALLEMPLFMDTPFGRLSLEHRKNLVETVPTFCAQWILLATDTEFRKQEASLLKRGGRWGKFYSLQSEGPGVTIIQERNINDAQSMLSDVMEG